MGLSHEIQVRIQTLPKLEWWVSHAFGSVPWNTDQSTARISQGPFLGLHFEGYFWNNLVSGRTWWNFSAELSVWFFCLDLSPQVAWRSSSDMKNNKRGIRITNYFLQWFFFTYIVFPLKQIELVTSWLHVEVEWWSVVPRFSWAEHIQSDTGTGCSSLLIKKSCRI